VEVLTWRGLVTYYVLFFIHLESRRVSVAGITKHPNEEWMVQIARSATQETLGHLHPCRYVLHDRDTKFSASFRSTLADGGVKSIRLPAKSPNLNAFAERWVRSVKQECLSKLILFGEGPLSRTLTEFLAHVTDSVNQEPLLQNEYLVAKNRILRAKLPPQFSQIGPPLWPAAESRSKVIERGSVAGAGSMMLPKERH
jgi:putative transposase